jgi:diguanylate cyclase (GGDEF)-like protein
MRSRVLNLSARLAGTVLVLLTIFGVGISLVIQSLLSVEKILEQESIEHIDSLTVNSVVSREIFDLSSRVRLLEQTFLYNESVLSEEGFNIDEQLQRVRALSDDEQFVVQMDLFIQDFHRFLGNSLTLNRILQEITQIDARLESQIDQLDYLVAAYMVEEVLKDNSLQISDHVDLMNMLRETYLSTGKMVGSVRSRITPDTETVVIIQVLKELDIFRMHLTNLEAFNPEILAAKKALSRTLARYTAALRKMRANLDQRWLVMNALVGSQNELISYVERTEANVHDSAVSLKGRLGEDLSNMRIKVVAVGLFAIVVGIILVIHMVRRHIREPLNALTEGFKQLESSEFNQRVNLKRQDEWGTIESAFNKMASRLEQTYVELNNEKSKFNYLAHHDPLTGMGNRLFVQQALDKVISDSDQDSPFTMLYLDVDQFKNINDSLGHDAGDELLRGVSERLKSLIGAKGKVARLGGDEFMVIGDGVPDLQGAANLARSINEILRKPFIIAGEPIFVTSSIGVCRYPDHGIDPATLIRNADTAMYHAKRQGRDQYCIYKDSMTHEAHDLIYKSAGIRRALENDEFLLVYQPQFELNTGKVIGAEALIRWDNPELGLLSPGAFLGIAEQTGLIVDLDNWVLARVFKEMCQWQKMGIAFEGLTFSVNFSGRKFFSQGLKAELSEIIESNPSLAHHITLEITERDMMTNLDRCRESIEQIKTLGFKVSIDDFGTGYSSLSSLKHLPADTLKLDRSFIIDIDDGNTDMAIVRSVLSIADELGMDVVAEGVETHAQLECLKAIECGHAQGYYLSYPISKLEWERRLLGLQQAS